MPDFSNEQLIQFHRRSTMKGLMIFSLDAVSYLLAIIGTVVSTYWLFKLLFALAAGLFTSLLFVVGHDACHQALTGSRRLNGLIGRLAFLPSLYPFSLWDLGHNRTHHRYTNQKGRDYVWEPLTPLEYRGVSLWGRLRYRFYRSLIGHFWYSLVEIWWRKMMFPRKLEIGEYRTVYLVDLGLVCGWLVFLPVSLVASTGPFFSRPAMEYIDILIYALLIPLLLFNMIMSFVIYLHHTHPCVKWVRPDDQSNLRDMQIRGAAHVIFPQPINWIFHRILEHPAHHLRPAIPMYNLLAAQELILKDNPNDALVYRWSLRIHLSILRRCKLFDIERGIWLDFDGNDAQ